MKRVHAEICQKDILYSASVHVSGYVRQVMAGSLYSPLFGEQAFCSARELIILIKNRSMNCR